MRIPVDGADLYAEDSGGVGLPPLMLCNGARCNTRMWEPLLPALERRFRVLRSDIRGTGRSRLFPDGELSLDRYADDAAAVLDHFSVPRCIVWGMAFGSRVALAMASRLPGRVSALALYDASVERPDPEAQTKSAFRAHERRRVLGMNQPTVDHEWFTNDQPETTQAALRAAYTGSEHVRYTDGLTLPTLIATGDLDPNLVPSRRLHELIPGSELVVLEAVGHGSVLQRPELCLEVFERFVDRLGFPS